MKILTNAIKQTLENNEDPKEKLSIWLKVMNTMDSIVTILKNQTARVNLICFVKVRIIYVQFNYLIATF